jgi:hypothetical protein
LTLLKDQLQSVLPKLLGASGNFELIVFGIMMVLMLQRARDGMWPYIRKWLPQQPDAVAPDAALALPMRARHARWPDRAASQEGAQGIRRAGGRQRPGRSMSKPVRS